MNKYILFLFVLLMVSYAKAQELVDIEVDSDITAVQPMTGIVFWPGESGSNVDSDAIALEYSYMSYKDVVTAKDVYDWTVVEEMLEDISSRNHQAILRFRFSYPGRTTTIPQYILDQEGYDEIVGKSEGNDTSFPDWTNEELKRFTLAFYKEFGELYDEDNRLAFVQTGFGLWSEYHIYDGPFILGKTFPSKEFQKEFFAAMEDSFDKTYWNISIDAASGSYSPFSTDEELIDLEFGLFDDSFMSAEHAGYNEESWNFFDRERYLTSPGGGEFNYYTDYDQQHVLTPHTGPHGEPWELAAERFHITYMIGNDQLSYQDMDRVKEASMYAGYKFKINSLKSAVGTSVVEIENVGLAPIYIDAFVTIDGVRSTETLKLLAPGEIKIVGVNAGGTSPVLTIESDEILETEEIQYYGTVNDPYVYVQDEDAVIPKDADKAPEDILSVNGEWSDKVRFYYQDSALSIQSTVELEYLMVLNEKGQQVYFNEDLADGFSNSVPIGTGLYVVKTNIGTAKLLLK